MTEAMSDERLAELKAYHAEYGINGTADGDSIISELLDEAERARKAEARLRDDVADRDYVNAKLRKSVEKYRGQLPETGEPELEWGVRSTNRSTGRTEDVTQPSEVSARSRVVSSNGASALICRTKAGKWREAEQGGA